jgi:hypothetical protein
MAEFNSSADAADQVADISQERWDEKSPDRPHSLAIAVRLLALLILALAIAGGAVVTAILQTAQLLRDGSGAGR